MEDNRLSIKREVLPFLNISLYLNNISLIRELVIENLDEKSSSNLELKIHVDQPCFEPFSYSMTSIPAGTDVRIPLDGLKINRKYITELSETEKAVISIELLENNDQIVLEEHTITVHPLEHFPGFQVLPELIAAYVTPNHPYVYHIKRKAIEILERNGQQTAFEGYQSIDPERILQIMSAIYSAIQSEGIIYSSLPPGYEETGQRLRLLHTIQQEKFGNCIDMSLLLAACLEAVDLNPLIILVRGHAFVGCWLNDDKFAETVNDDKAAITKRLSKGIREVAAVEATVLCKGQSIRFTDALHKGEAQLVEKDEFILSVDIKRARTARIRPLPLLNEAASSAILPDEPQEQETKKSSLESRFEIGSIYTDELLQDKQVITKQKIWERKLLDLSLRNNLLNLRFTRNMLQLVDIDISHLEDTLSEGKSFSILPDSRAEILRRYHLFMPPLHQSSPLYQMANDELKHNRLYTYYHQQDLDSILTYIHKNAKKAIEENGASTMYLAVGLLKWYDRKTPQQARYAPILLLPIELNRRSVNSRFTLKSREEETMINITLLEFLRQEYQLDLGALEQLPTDEKGVDVSKVMGTIRRAVMQLKGWDVEEQLILGNFSFSKLILWKDIVVHQEALLKSDMVRSLVEGEAAFVSSDNEDEHLDFDSIHPTKVALPIPTDVSQMDAVLTAQRGKNFILHGPPGTGKSQTITNIIADALFQKKRVLFVAAKKAALDVVHKRLEQIGLAPFTLELHSNKSKKSDVLAQLASSMEAIRGKSSGNHQQEADRLHAVRNEISGYIHELHRVQPIGWNLYDSIERLDQFVKENFPKIFIPDEVYQNLNKGLWQKWEDWLPQFESVVQLIDPPGDHPLRLLDLPSYSKRLQDEITLQTQELLINLEENEKEAAALTKKLQFPFTISSHKDWIAFGEMANRLHSLPDMPVSLPIYLADKENQKTFSDWLDHLEKHQSLIEKLLEQYDQNILKEDLSSLHLQWKRARKNWFLPRWINKNRIKKQLAVYRNTKFSQDTEIESLFSLHDHLDKTQDSLNQSRFTETQKALRSLYKDNETDLAAIREKVTAITSLKETTGAFGPNAFGQWFHSWDELRAATYTDDVILSHKPSLAKFRIHSQAFQESQKAYNTLTGVSLNGTQESEDWFISKKATLQSIHSQLSQLKNWMNYVKIKALGSELSLDWFIEQFERQTFPSESVKDCFYYTIHRELAERTIAESEALNLFDRNLLSSKIEQYKKLSEDFRKLTKQELCARLFSRFPNTKGGAMPSSEIGILQRAIKNRGRGLSIRKLFDQIPMLLPRIAPCMLMSPISVAQYFDVDTSHFDLVIFDEASQLPTCEAISALARAKQAVIVGDPKQMPPTSFFNTTKIDEENMEVEDLESILDDCLALSVPSKHLLRHYRSKHESLIAFSNANYYENKLLTFPSADDLSKKVIHHPVKGFYDKGKTRQNRFEAESIITFIQEHYSNPQHSSLSLGVVTFSQAQQSLIEDLLQELFISNPEVEIAASECAEPVFIKNLENVQGDERDIILFSIGYGPDEEGKMSMNFGPINREGGWRRLNVAVTRARYEMHVFATLSSDRIDLSRTSSEGVAGLKSFLHFAEKGHLALRPEGIQTDYSAISLPKSIVKMLEEKGLSAKCNIGSSGFKVDVGIVHPNRPEHYILGILIDGRYYWDAKTMNDREMVMPSVLKMLGWNIFRLWALDWYEHADRIVSEIVAEVERLKTEPQEPTAEKPELNESNSQETVEEEEEPAAKESNLEQKSYQKPYEIAVLSPVIGGSSENIYEHYNRPTLEAQIKEVINKEAPISKSLLYRRILPIWNISRAGAKLDGYLEGILKELGVLCSPHHQPFYVSMPTNEELTSMNYYRANDIAKRDMEDIAPEELGVAILEALHQSLSIEEDELLRHVARVFGFAKVGRQIDTLLRYAISMLEKQGKLKREDGRVMIV